MAIERMDKQLLIGV